MISPRRKPYSDPIIAWPNWVMELSDVIGDLQRLNPDLGLVAIEDYLLYHGSERDVVTLAMPESASDDLVAGFTQCNYEWMPAAGGYRKGARRFERTADGNLRIRPHTWELEEAGYGRFNRVARSGGKGGLAFIDRMQRIAKSWFIFRPNNEIWEVDFSYMTADYLEGAGQRTNSEFWRIVPVGTVCYIDRNDLPIDEHYSRARAIVEAGSAFAIVADVENREIRIFRAGSVQISKESVCIPEMPWFEIPVTVEDGEY